MESERRALWRGQDGLVRVRILLEGLTVKCVEYRVNVILPSHSSHVKPHCTGDIIAMPL